MLNDKPIFVAKRRTFYGLIRAAIGLILALFIYSVAQESEADKLKQVVGWMFGGLFGSGGVFAPALVCGGSLGAAVGLCFKSLLPDAFGIHPAAFALVGMAGFLASAVRIPMTAIVIVSEISGNHGLLLPAMWVCGISFWLNDGWSLYRSQPHSRVTSMLHG